ncbi:MAG: DNA primase [Gammaproteobacteria bacterium]|nr:DNA primase [Gammaproteobacteria bacterium]
MAAGRIPQSFIDELLARVDIVEVIDAHLPLRKVGRSYQALCPFHREKTPSFNVNPDKQFYHCFGCGASGSAIRFLMEHARLGFVEAVTQLADRVGLEIPTDTGAVRRQGHAELYAVLDEAAQWFVAQLGQHPAAGPAVAYLKQRGLSGRIAAAYRIGYAPPGWDHLLCGLGTDPDRVDALVRGGILARKDGGACYDRFRDRVMFPIEDPRGHVIGFGGRVIGEGSPKYLNSPETPIFHKGGEVYGLRQALQGHDKPKRLFVVEGYMDVLALAQHGITNAVATLGTALTREHLGRLFRVVPDLVFCFDGDEAGLRAAWRALETALAYLSEGRSVGFLILPNGEDPDSLVRAEGPGLFERAEAITPLSTFLFDTLSARTDPRSVEGQARLLEIALPLVATVPRGPLRDLLTQHLSDRARMDATRWLAPGSRPRSTSSRGEPKHAVPSLVRKAIATLLHEPSLALAVPADSVQDLAGVSRPGVDLLVEILGLVHANPGIGCAAILERYRDSEQGTYLSKLASQEVLVPAAGLSSELLGALERLKDQAAQARRHQATVEELTQGAGDQAP